MERLEIVNYTPSHFDTLLAGTPELTADSTLRHKGFVDHYYGSSSHCGLYLAVDASGRVRGTLGVERMPFFEGDRAFVLGFGSNFNAFQPGVGAYLFFHWLRNCEGGIALGGSEDTHRMLTRARWTYPEGVRTFILNRSFDEPGKSGGLQGIVRNLLKRVSQRHPLARLCRRLSSEQREQVSTIELQSFDELSLDFPSAFSFRFAPDQDYLSWRYRLGLTFARYRLFQINRRGQPMGFVILQERPDQVLVSHSDGADASMLAVGIVQCLSSLHGNNKDRREVRIVSSHPGMEAVFRLVGFRNRPRWDRPLAFGALRGKLEIPGPTSQWLVNYDWGDNGLRTPFLDQQPRV